ncbi:hypothetical protein [Coraliomargarita parva]|uniref:hypothetical protein n=1 Tax=Coraliomargarita parva TaxID=3014050 RepID=UPI0022B476BD|nr:hypothetical protein [Coraliomargarita parva]
MTKCIGLDVMCRKEQNSNLISLGGEKAPKICLGLVRLQTLHRFDKLKAGRFDKLKAGRFDKLKTGRFDKLKTGRFARGGV